MTDLARFRFVDSFPEPICGKAASPAPSGKAEANCKNDRRETPAQVRAENAPMLMLGAFKL